jgi:hypothetical protein
VRKAAAFSARPAPAMFAPPPVIHRIEWPDRPVHSCTGFASTSMTPGRREWSALVRLSNLPMAPLPALDSSIITYSGRTNSSSQNTCPR